MSFSFKNVQGDSSTISAELTTQIQHAREDEIIPVITQSIDNIVSALGGYLSVSASGHLNPASGETGDTVDIRIVSLSAPESATPITTPTLVEVSATPSLSTSEALSQSIATNNPGGSAAPSEGTEADGNSDGTPGLTSGPVPTQAVETPVVPAPVEPVVTQEVVSDPTPVAEPELDPVASETPETPNSPTTDVGENVAQSDPTPAVSPVTTAPETAVETPTFNPTSEPIDTDGDGVNDAGGVPTSPSPPPLGEPTWTPPAPASSTGE